jgi:adenine deaminase
MIRINGFLLIGRKEGNGFMNARILSRDTALGKEKADLVTKKHKVANMHIGEIYQADVAIKGRRIAYVGNVDHKIRL